MGEYRPRVLDELVSNRLKRSGALLIAGSKWSGKTRTSEMHCNSALYIKNAIDVDVIRKSLQTKVSAFYLKGESPRLIDEWQSVPEIWDEVRFIVDHDSDMRYILTGSSVVPEESILHSGIGRISRVTMRPMSLYESGESDGTISLKSLFDGQSEILARSTLNLEGLVHATVRGGWPEAVISEDYEESAFAADYVDAICADMSALFRSQDGRRSKNNLNSKEPEDAITKGITRRTLQSLSRNLGTPASISKIYEDVSGSGEYSVSRPKFERYLSNLKSLYILENLPVWNAHIRSSAKLLTKPKWHFTDPSLAASCLNANFNRLMYDLNAYGFYFESMCLRDLRVYLEPLGGQVSYYGDTGNLEVDFVVETRDGRWGAFEVKLGTDEFDKAATNLLKFKDRVDTKRMGEPVFLAILTGSDTGYTREDGVHVIPIGCFGP